MVAATSAVPAQRTMIAGRRSIIPFHTRRAPSYSGSAGTMTAPCIRSRRAAIVLEAIVGPITGGVAVMRQSSGGCDWATATPVSQRPVVGADVRFGVKTSRVQQLNRATAGPYQALCTHLAEYPHDHFPHRANCGRQFLLARMSNKFRAGLLLRRQIKKMPGQTLAKRPESARLKLVDVVGDSSACLRQQGSGDAYIAVREIGRASCRER